MIRLNSLCMKKLSAIFIVIISILSVNSCDKINQEQTDLGYPVQEFNVLVNDICYHGNIDHQALTITIGTIENADDITSVEYTLNNNIVSILPEPSSLLGKWEKEQTFDFLSNDGTKSSYNLVFPKLREGPIRHEGKIVSGYITVNDYQFDAMFDKISWTAMTYVLPSFAYVKADGTLDTEAVDSKLDRIKEKANEYGVEILLSIAKKENDSFRRAISTAESRERLAQSIFDYLKKIKVSGLDIDYEDYPINPADQKNMCEFMEVLKPKLNGKYILSTAINAGNWLSYSIKWPTYFDYVNVMIYDLERTDIPYQSSGMDRFRREIQKCINYYQIPKSKIVPGLPFYGHIWENGQPKALRFSDIIKRYPYDSSVIYNDHIDGTTIYYNGKNLIREKCQYIIDNDLAGAMIWQMFQDAERPEDQLAGVVMEVLSTKN